MAQAAQNVFIVDDDESVRASLRLLVESAGHRAVTFASAEEFLQSGFMKDADCLILDIRMPGMGGFELQEHLASLRTPHSGHIYNRARPVRHGRKGNETGCHCLSQKTF